MKELLELMTSWIKVHGTERRNVFKYDDGTWLTLTHCLTNNSLHHKMMQYQYAYFYILFNSQTFLI